MRDDDRLRGLPWLKTNFPLFSAQVLEADGWRSLGEVQRAPEVACLLLADYIRGKRPDAPASQDDVGSAIRRLKDGAREVAIGDHPHRIMRTDVYFDMPLQVIRMM
jgi:hypothetical protein